MKPFPATLTYDAATGVTLHWPGAGLSATALPLRVRVQGHGVFYVWGGFDSGEGAPAWAEPEFDLTFFGPGSDPEIERILAGRTLRGYRLAGRHPRCEVALELRFAADGELRLGLQLRNPQSVGGQRLPLCRVELRLEDVELGTDGTFLSAHAYGGRTHGAGRLAELVGPGMPFHHGTIGLALPLVLLHDPATDRGVQLEFMCDGRPTLWLQPGTQAPRATVALQWTPERLLLHGQVHAIGGAFALRPFHGAPVAQLRAWRDAADTRYGLRPPPLADWVQQRSCIEIWLHVGASKEYTRFDDPKLYARLKRWRAWGYNALMVVAPNPTGKHPLSPFHYGPNEQCGGAAAEQVLLGWIHELGFHAGIWFTTVGLDRLAPQIETRRDWWTHRANLDLFYAWDANAQNGFVGYAPDGDPAATGWRRFMEAQLASLLARGWDGVFIDGCIPRSSNHARWFWPGEPRNAVEDQVIAIGEAIRAAKTGAILVSEDGGLGAQVSAEVHCGRYTPMTPYLKKAYWDHGMGGGPALTGAPPPRLAPERVREYLLVRYASMLPGAIAEDGVEGYCSEEARPWTVQSMLAGPNTFKTHCEYVDDPLTFRQLGDAPSAGPLAKDPARRQQGHDEYLRLLKFRETEPLVHARVPLSIEAVVVTGNAAVVGLLRPTPARCLLVLLNFANHPATVSVALAAPVDVPAVQRPAIGTVHRATWQVREFLHSLAEDAAAPAARLRPTQPLAATLGAYGFRVYELLRG